MATKLKNNQLDDSIVDTTSVQTLTNKTLSNLTLVGTDIIDTTNITDVAVTGTKISKTVIEDGSIVVPQGSTYLLSAGIYQFVSIRFTALQLFINGTWEGYAGESTASMDVTGIVISDGINMRLKETYTGATFYYQKF